MASEIDVICIDSSEESDDEKADTVTAHMRFPNETAKKNNPEETNNNFLNDSGETGKSIDANLSLSPSSKSFQDEAICPEKSVQFTPVASNSNMDTTCSSCMDNDFASDYEKAIFSDKSGSSPLTFPKLNPLGQSPVSLPGHCHKKGTDARRIEEKRQGSSESRSVPDVAAVFASQKLKVERTSDCFSRGSSGRTSIESDGHYYDGEFSSMTNLQLQNIRGTKMFFGDDKKLIKNKKFKHSSGEFKETVKPLPNEIISGKDFKIKKLEEALEKCNKEIKKLDESEVDLDGDDDQSAYVIASRYKERYMQIRQKIADIKNIPSELGRKSDKPFHFRESKYSIVNRKIENFINRNKTFPDFQDICKVIRDANAEANLFTKAQLHSEAEEIFRKVGKKLKSRRLSDDDDVMSSYLPQCGGSAADDPADKDSQLERKLQNNIKEGQKLIDEFLDDVQEKQEVEEHSFNASDSDECDSLDGHESDSVDNNSDEEGEMNGSENEVDKIGRGLGSEKFEKKSKLVVIEKGEDRCLNAFENDATIDELLESDEEGENVIEADDCKNLDSFEMSIKNRHNVKDISGEEKTHSEVITKTEMLPCAVNVTRTVEDSNACGMFEKIHMKEHVEKGNTIFGENLPNKVIIIDD